MSETRNIEPGAVGVQDAPSRHAATPPDLRFARETITPERASALLSRAVAPQPNAAATETYARSMKDGAWILNGQSIVIDPAGRLLDGVQRLNACIVAGVPFETHVAYNVLSDTLHTLDQHRRRFFSGVLESRNYTNAAALQRLMSRLIRLQNGAILQPKLSIGWARYDRVFSANPELVEATDLVERVAGHGLAPTSALEALAFMGLRAGPEAAAKIGPFLAELGEVDPTGVDNAAKLLSFQMATARNVGPGYEVTQALALLILAFNDYLAGRLTSGGYTWEPVTGRLTQKEREAGLSERQIKALERARAPFNGGFPEVRGYKGLREGTFETDTAEDFGGALKAELLRGIGRTRDDAQIAMMRITPARARRMLDFNTGNRRIQADHYKAIARDILGDRWMVNAQAISFAGDPDHPDPADPPQLLNGQHRLHAIIEADMAIDVPVAVNIPREAFATFDIHAKKGTRAPVSSGYSRVLQAALRLQWKEDMGRPLVGRGSPTAGESLETLERHPGLTEVLTASRRKPLLAYASSGVLAYFIYRIQREDPLLAEEYLEKLAGDGAGLLRGDPVLKIRAVAHESRHSTRKTMLDLLLENWAAYRKWRGPAG